MGSEEIVNKSKKFLSDFVEKADQMSRNLTLPKVESKQNDDGWSGWWERLEKQLQGGWDSVSDSFGSSGRYFDAFQTLSSLFYRYQMLKFKSRLLSAEEQQAQENQLHEQGSDELALLCKKMGGAWVKAAQFLSCHTEELPAIYSEKLSALQDQGEPVPWEKMKPVLTESLGPGWEKNFSSIEQTPLATASIGQVHQVNLAYGPKVALKIQIPGVQETIEKDLKFFETVARLLNSQVEIMDLEQVVRELSKSIRLELDYYQEAHNLTQFFSRYESQQWEYPILVNDLLTAKTMGMHFIEGQPIRQFLDETPSAAKPVLTELVQSFLKQIFKTGLFHADPHPGNFFVTPRGKIALLDFGAVGELSQEETLAYRNVLTALLMEQWENFDQLLETSGFETSDPETLMKLLSEEKPKELNELTKIQYYLEVMRRAHVKVPDKFVLMARVLIVIGGLLRKHQVRLNMTDLAFSLMM